MDNFPTIMIVDDDNLVSELLNTFLQREGYRVIMARDGTSALGLLQVCSPDLILMDLIMPGINGVALLSVVRRHSQVPIIMISAISEPSFVQKALADGADDYVTKPFKLPVLKASIEALLNKSGFYAAAHE